MSDDWIELTAEELPVSKAIRFVTADDAGGINIFLGTTRSETRPDGKALLALDYESFREMAEPQLKELARRARERWPIKKLALLHRTGRVAIRHPSVVIAVSTAHRAASFEACQWLIDLLKKEVAVWKKEVWEGGEGTWVDPGVNSKNEI